MQAPVPRRISTDDLSGDWGKDSSDLLAALNAFNGDVSGALNRGLSLAENLGWQKIVFPSVTMPASPWVSLTLLNSWVAFGGAEAAPQYRVDPVTGEVAMKGLIKSGTAAAGTQVASFPAALNPSENQSFAVRSGSGGVDTAGSIVVGAAGGVFIFLGGNSYLSLTARWLPASPAPYVPSCFPLKARSTLPSQGGLASLVIPGLVQDITPNSTAIVPALGVPQWHNETSVVGGQYANAIVLDNLPGLVSGRTYSITLWAAGG